jgi:hypothetical protein
VTYMKKMVFCGSEDSWYGSKETRLCQVSQQARSDSNKCLVWLR